MSANLFNGRTRPEALAAAIDTHRPDVVACQELAANAAEVLEERFPHGVLRPRDDHHGGGIVASRAVEIAPLALTGRDGWTARLSPLVWPEIPTDTTVTSVHFTSPLVRPLRASLAERRGQVSDTLEHVSGVAEPLVIVGDFNATPLWPAYRRVNAHIPDGVALHGRTRRTWGPWWWFPRLLRIDHAFVRGLRVASVETVRIAGMDHSALIVDVTASTD